MLIVIPLLAVQILALACVTVLVLHPTTLTPTPTAHVRSVSLQGFFALVKLRQYEAADVGVDLLYCLFICVRTENHCTLSGELGFCICSNFLAE